MLTSSKNLTRKELIKMIATLRGVMYECHAALGPCGNNWGEDELQHLRQDIETAIERSSFCIHEDDEPDGEEDREEREVLSDETWKDGRDTIRVAWQSRPQADDSKTKAKIIRKGEEEKKTSTTSMTKWEPPPPPEFGPHSAHYPYWD